MGAGVVLPNA